VLCVASFFDCLFLVALSVFSNVYLTIKTSASPEACIVDHLILLLSMLITVFSEFARNSPFFYLKCACSVNNTLSLTAVPDRRRCVISLVEYLLSLLCVVKSLFLCVLIFHVLFFTFFTPVYKHL
jgi:hypothetical protein